MATYRLPGEGSAGVELRHLPAPLAASSATVDPARLERAKELTGVTSVSGVLERGLAALIEDELERIHTDGYTRVPQAGETVTTVDAAVWDDLPWDEE
jgi:hypothetical protein